MRVATSLSSTERLRVIEVASRPLKRGEVRVRVGAIGVNPVDWKMREGGPLRFAYQFLGPAGPQVVGVDFAGTVTEVEPSVTDLAVGDRVVGGTDFSRGQTGSYADEVIARPDQCAKLPDEIDFDHAACLPVPAVTAWMAMREHTKIGPGQKVLVVGASGGVGLAAIQLARMLGAKAAGICSTRNVGIVEKYGAVALDYTQGDALEAARAHGPYDLVLHLVGTATYPLGVCRSLLAKGGRVELVVVRPADYPSVAFLPSVGTVLGKPTRERLTPLVAALARGDLDPLIAERIPLAEAERAHEISRAGKVVGKLLLIP